MSEGERGGGGREGGREAGREGGREGGREREKKRNTDKEWSQSPCLTEPVVQARTAVATVTGQNHLDGRRTRPVCEAKPAPKPMPCRR